MRGRRSILTVAGLVVIAIAVALLESRTPPTPVAGEAVEVIESAYRERRSDFMVEVEGAVVRLLSDDNRGSRHQRFVIELPGGHTLLVSHNIDLAPKVPLDEGDSVSVRGEYEWNERGGVLHWTHHDPSGRRPGGWVKVRGQTYR